MIIIRWRKYSITPSISPIFWNLPICCVTRPINNNTYHHNNNIHYSNNNYYNIYYNNISYNYTTTTSLATI